MIRLYLIFIFLFYNVTSLQQQQQIKFSQRLYQFKIIKNYGINDKIGQISLININESLNSNYLIKMEASRDANSDNLFNLNNKTFEIKLKKQKITAKDIGRHYFRIFCYKSSNNKQILAMSSLIIDITDPQINNPPTFKKQNYEAFIIENNPPDTLILQVEAQDSDVGANGQLRYHLINGNTLNSNLFQIESNTGEIFAKKALNSEIKNIYKLTVLAIDNSPMNRLSTTTNVVIKVLNQASSSLYNSFSFEYPIYRINLPEDTNYVYKPIILENVKALIDKQPNNHITYSLSGTLNDMNTFEIEPLTGNVRLVSKLNYQHKNGYKLSIIGRDDGEPATACYSTLEIKIINMNRVAPVFGSPFYEFIMFENVPIGYNVGTVTAFDKNAIDAHRITYKLIKSFSNHYDSTQQTFPFVIDQNNGTISTTQQLKRSMKSEYEFYIIATETTNDNIESFEMINDNNKLYLNSTVKVKIKILDLNVNIPEFSQTNYHINVSEDAGMFGGLPLLNIYVINRADIGSNLDYSIIEHSTVDNKNIFKLVQTSSSSRHVSLILAKNGVLNYKIQKYYKLEIKVIDQDGLYSTCFVHVNVVPANSNVPRFNKSIYKFNIFENASIGTKIGRVEATLIESNYYKPIKYRLITDLFSVTPADNNNFKIDSTTGDIYISNELDRENNANSDGSVQEESIVYTLYITCSTSDDTNDNGMNNKDYAVIEIYVYDINDNKPIFTRSSSQYFGTVYLNSQSGDYIIRAEALDLDSGRNAIIKYSLLDHNEKK
jgi:hypothetical protein